MMQSDDQKSELLWKHIEDIKSDANAERTQLPPSATHNGAGLNGLTELSHAVFHSLQTHEEATEGQDSARARLEEAIRSERSMTVPSGSAPEISGRRWKRPFFTTDRKALLIALILMLIILISCFAIWMMNQSHCGASPLPSPPSDLLPAPRTEAAPAVSKSGALQPSSATPSPQISLSCPNSGAAPLKSKPSTRH